MGNLKHIDAEQTHPNDEWSYTENQDVREFLVHIADLIAKEYVERMKRAP